ncbi:tetratricopeptide repeat protein [Moraxella pluranimalium]|uniref:Sel1 repeat family protein n=1 Tax=Moraxella pluranimalium TaxID=470453 RepID=A0A1T0CMZ5_9GAMM|nr:tetratricopeptide repeat protein [Moraxella pluranimalium]OOS23629.1 hypothetical protein B0680_06660 [Moraxella pluranimalium]
MKKFSALVAGLILSVSAWSADFYTILTKAQGGDVSAQSELGTMYYLGKETKQDYQKANEWLTKAAHQGDTNALYYLGLLYSNSQYTANDEQKAFEFLRQSAELNYPTAQTSFGLRLIGQNNCNDGIAWLEKAANQGDDSAFLFLEFIYQEFTDKELRIHNTLYPQCPKNNTKYFYWTHKHALTGNPYAQSQLASLYLTGIGTAIDYQQAYYWASLASDNDSSYGSAIVANLYRNGLGVAKNPTKAIEYYKKTISQIQGELARQIDGLVKDSSQQLLNSSMSMLASYYYELGMYTHAHGYLTQLLYTTEANAAKSLLATMYSEGLGVTKNEEQAFVYNKDLAELGFPENQFNVGLAYHLGLGVQIDYHQAVYWYTLAANQGISDAQLNLGVLYAEGQGVRQDDKTAFNWYAKAAAQGNTIAQENIGSFYYDGTGVRQNKTLAKEWYGKACDGGSQDGCDMYRQLKQAGY